MKALSVRAPWWWFILYAGKDIENRDWPTSFRGTVYLHASKWFRLPSVACDAIAAIEMHDRSGAHLQAETSYGEMKRSCGCIVGQVDIVDCVTASASPWFQGRFGFVLANPVAFKVPVPCKGSLGFFAVPGDVQAVLDGA